MSRHRFVKALDLDNELDVYDGDEAYGEDGYDDDAERQLKDGTVKVKAVVGDGFPDAEIRDALWHYYYDVEKSVNYLLNSRIPKPQKKAKPATKNAKECGRTRRDAYNQSEPITDFFQDSPWFNVPPERMAEITVTPLRPSNGLLGGASGTPKQSKLGALAAARKRKENERSGESSGPVHTSVALLDKLTLKNKDTGSSDGNVKSPGQPVSKDLEEAVENPKRTRRYLPRKKKSEEDQVTMEEIKPLNLTKAPSIPQEDPEDPTPFLLPPSSFAQTLCGISSSITTTTQADAGHNFYDIFPEKHTENPFAGPSPDDIVSKAQSTSKGLKSTKGPTKDQPKPKDAGGLSSELERTKLDDTPRVKSKNIDVVAEYEKAPKKNTANFVVIGHVDAGKSTLMGRLLHELSIVDKRTLDKYQKDASNMGKASFALAWIMDASADERSRGVTIDIAMSKFETDSTIFTILDAPGHRDFVPNMIAGASRADFAVLVVDASTNNFESGLKGQTKEHALLVRSLGVQRLIVAVNKLDAVHWSQERFDEICQQTSSFLGAAGFQTANVAFVPCSGLQGENVTKRSEVPALAAWYTGTSLLEQLEAAASPRTYPIRGPLRMPVADILIGGTVYPLSLLGRLTSGTLQVGDAIVAIPSNVTGSIRALEVDGAPAEYAVAGQNATLHVSADMVDAAQQLRTGDIVCAPTHPVPTHTHFSIKALAFTHLTPMFVSIIAGRADVPGRIDALTAVLDKTSGQPTTDEKSKKKKRPRIVKPGEVARLSVAVEADGGAGLPIEQGGRVVLRSGGETVATGLVE